MKRILAIAGLAIIVLLYILTLVFAIIGDPQSNTLFKAAIFSTVVIPCMIYGYAVLIKAIRGPKSKEKDDLDK